MPELAATCDFLIIGAGIAGVSLAKELRARGVSVAVAEATQVCGGSSALNAGGVRQQFSQPLNIILARRTVEYLGELTEQGIDLAHRQVGYLFMISDMRAVPALQAAVKVQNELHVPTRWLSVDEIVEMVPGVRPEGLVGATFCPTDGYLDPNTLVTAIAADARRAGAVIASNTAVIGFQHSGTRITGVRLSTGSSVSAGVVVNCAGAWSDGIARLYGATLPITPWRAQLFIIEGATGVPNDSPYVIDFHNGKTFYHPEAGNTLLAGTDADDACEASWHVPFDQARSEPVVERLISRFTSFDDARVGRGWPGMLEITADENPIADWTHFENMYTMAGFSGHGLPIAPSLAAEASLVLTGAEPTLDLSPYRAERFDQAIPPESMELMAMR
jgi:sarcosine oxidase subunit beta